MIYILEGIGTIWTTFADVFVQAVQVGVDQRAVAGPESSEVTLGLPREELFRRVDIRWLLFQDLAGSKGPDRLCNCGGVDGLDGLLDG